MQQHKTFIGIDVSKLTFDASLLPVVDYERQPISTRQFKNNADGLARYGRWLAANGATPTADTLTVVENTGIYHRALWQYHADSGLPFHIGNGAHIKKSFGVARGKSDAVDSRRLCLYAHKDAEDLLRTPPPDPAIIALGDLEAARTLLVKHRMATRTLLKELKGCKDPMTQARLEGFHKAALDGADASIKEIEAEIKALVASSEAMSRNYGLLTSIPGVGHVSAVYLIICTANFARQPTGKQLACYAGVAPFEHTSGTSIRGRARVHHMANKKLKKLLHLCALSSIQHNPEMKAYYERKVAEGKHKMSILNAVRNKIALRCAAVIKKQEPYVVQYQYAA